MEEQSKINDILKILNEGTIKGDWIASPGKNALTTVDYDGKNASFHPNNGIPLKVFANTKTGEIKIYDARAFIKDFTNGK